MEKLTRKERELILLQIIEKIEKLNRIRINKSKSKEKGA